MATRTRAADSKDLVVRKARGMGRGVFAGRAFEAWEFIEVCPVLVLSAEQVEKGLGSLESYVFLWGEGGDLALALGYGSLYNHSSDPNAEFNPRLGRGEITFRALRRIEAGEQIFINYRWDEADFKAFGVPA
jgi:hypothetical protein